MKLSETRLSKYLHISKYSFSCEFKHANTNATCLFSFKHMNVHMWPVEKRLWCWVIHTASCIPDYSASVLIKERTLLRVFLFKWLSELYCCLWDVLKQRSNLKTAKFAKTYYFRSARVKKVLAKWKPIFHPAWPRLSPPAWGFMLLPFRPKAPVLQAFSNQQILVIMSDTTKKHSWLICYFGRAGDVSFSALENVFLVLWWGRCLKGDFAQEVCVFSPVQVVYLDVDYG